MSHILPIEYYVEQYALDSNNKWDWARVVICTTEEYSVALMQYLGNKTPGARFRVRAIQEIGNTHDD
jgi:hypothetical protein